MKVSDVVDFVVGSVQAAFVGAFVGALGFSLVALVANLLEYSIGFSKILVVRAAVVGAVVGPVFLIVWSVGDSAAQRRRQRERDRRARQKEAVEEAERKRGRISQLSTLIQTTCDESVLSFERLPNDLKNAREWLAESRDHFGNRAYSPFWRAVENAYDNLGWYNRRLNSIAELSLNYTKAVSQYSEAGGAGGVSDFPVTLNAARATEAAERIVKDLSGIVYQAQCDPVFAQIWEQRRTTTAVVEGFGNLELAVNRMSRTLQSSIGSLNSSVGSLTSEVSGLGSRISESSSHALALGADQLAAQKQLNGRVDQAVYYLREENKRAIGLL